MNRFVTGYTKMPSDGSLTIDIQYIHENHGYPSSKTCIFTLFLPFCENKQELETKLKESFEHSSFHKV